MYLYLWIVFIGMILLPSLPLISSKNRTRWKISQAIAVTAAVVLAIFAIEMLQMPPIMPIIFVVVISFLVDKSLYTKTGLIIAGMVVTLLIAGAYYLFHEDPNYVQSYIDNNPNLASMHLRVDGETIVSKEGSVKRPLASVAKTIIAIDYANQVAEGAVDPMERIPLAELDKFFLANTDGGAHPAWLEEMRTAGEIINDEVPLHEVAKGMIRFSSNANTDFMIEKLGPESINHVIDMLELENHDPVIPIVSSLLASTYLDVQHDGMLSNSQLEELLASMTPEEYRELAWEIHEELKQGEPDFFSGTVSISMDLQKIWSDRLPNATADDYAKVMSAISNHTATTPEASEVLRDVMEWPMELHASNRERYAHFGAKGGSTAFVLNQALYVEDLDGRKVELIIFTEGFSFIEQMKMNQNMNSYLINVLNDHLE